MRKQITVSDLITLLAALPEADKNLPVMVEGWENINEAVGIEITDYQGERVLLVINFGHGT